MNPPPSPGHLALCLEEGRAARGRCEFAGGQGAYGEEEEGRGNTSVGSGGSVPGGSSSGVVAGSTSRVGGRKDLFGDEGLSHGVKTGAESEGLSAVGGGGIPGGGMERGAGVDLFESGDGTSVNRNSSGGGTEGERERRKAKTLSELGLLDSSTSSGKTGLFGDDAFGEEDGLGWLAHASSRGRPAQR